MCKDRLYPFAICVAVLVGLLLPGAVGAQSEDQSVALRPRFVVGQSSRYRVWTLRQHHISMSSGDTTQDRDGQFEIEREVTWTVEQVDDDGSATCVMTRHWVAVRRTHHDGTIEVNDSREATGDNEALHQSLLAMIDVPLRLSVAADGSITAISGVEAIRQQVPDGNVPDDLEFMRFASELATIPFAPAAIAVGDEFEVEFSWPFPGLGIAPASMHRQGTYRLDAVESIAGVPIAVVKGTTTFTLDPDLSELPDGAPPMQIKLLEAEQTSEIYFDLWRHETVMSNVVRSVRHEIVMSSGDQTFTRTVDATYQSQVLRVGEE